MFRLLLATALATVGIVVAPVVTASGSAPVCTVEYTTTGQWDGGFQGSVTLTDLGSSMTGWSLGFDLPGDREVTQGWNAQWSQSGQVDVVRATGAGNLIPAGGLAYSNDLGQWLQHKPHEPAGNPAAAWHVHNVNVCANEECWYSTLAPVAAEVPLVADEIGENTCSHGFADRVMRWFDDRGLSCLGWTWNTWDCSSGPALISNYDGTPTPYGIGLRDHLRALDN